LIIIITFSIILHTGLRDVVNIDSIEFLAYLEERHITANPELLNEIRIYKEQQSLISNRQQLKLSSQSVDSNNSSNNSHNYNNTNTNGGPSKSYDRSTLNHSNNNDDNSNNNKGHEKNNKDDDDVEDDDTINVHNIKNNDISESIELLARGGLIAIDEDKTI
jgi:hypothetical protein